MGSDFLEDRRVFCAKHPTIALNFDNCQQCVDDTLEISKTYFDGNAVSFAYDNNGKKANVLIDGKETKRNHLKDYLECDIPIAIIEKINNYIDEEIKKYEQICDCFACQVERGLNIK